MEKDPHRKSAEKTEKGIKKWKKKEEKGEKKQSAERLAQKTGSDMCSSRRRRLSSASSFLPLVCGARRAHQKGGPWKGPKTKKKRKTPALVWQSLLLSMRIFSPFTLHPHVGQPSARALVVDTIV